MKFLFLIHYYDIIDGSASALFKIIKYNPEITDYLILCCDIKDKQKELVNIKKITKQSELEKELKTGNYDIVHHIKGQGHELFNWLINSMSALKLSIPIITTICQKPSFKGLWLNPNELKYSSSLIVIDKTSLNDALYKFVPKQKFVLNSFGRIQENLDLLERMHTEAELENTDSDTIIIGRGSTWNKCPQDLIEIFDRIKIDQKKFIIAGIEKGTWLDKKTQNREDISLIPPTSYEEWLKTCNKFDIFWYYLPDDCHSSLDGTLGDAMLLHKPVVYYGPEAPKERFHDKNGYIAQDKEEMLQLLEMLCKNKKLRKETGDQAAITTRQDYPLSRTISRYNEIYKTAFDKNDKTISFKIPRSYKLRFYFSDYKCGIRNFMSGLKIDHYINFFHNFYIPFIKWLKNK